MSAPDRSAARALVLAACVAGTLAARDARGDTGDESIDTSYGRFAGDLGFAGALGVAAGPRGLRGDLDLRFRYLSSVGIFASYEDGPIFASPADPKRALAFGLELRPLFIARWATGHEIGSPRLDLAIDSFALELGAVFSQPDGAAFGSRGGLQAGIGLELPFLSQPSGPFVGLHGGARWSERGLSGGPLGGPEDRALYLAIVVGWQALVASPLVDYDDRRGGPHR